MAVTLLISAKLNGAGAQAGPIQYGPSVGRGVHMSAISRGFSGRRTAADVKLPPGQYLTTDFPVLSAGPTPRVPLDQWEFTIDDGINVLRRWDWKAFRALPAETFMGAGHYPDAAR